LNRNGLNASGPSPQGKGRAESSATGDHRKTGVIDIAAIVRANGSKSGGRGPIIINPKDNYVQNRVKLDCIKTNQDLLPLVPVANAKTLPTVNPSQPNNNIEPEPSKKVSASGNLRVNNSSMQKPFSIQSWFEENRNSVTIIGGLLALVISALIICNVACRYLLNEASQKTNPEQARLAGMALWFAPFCHDSQLLSGIGLYREGKFKEARTVLQEVINSDPNCLEALDYHGLASYQLADYKSVIADYDRLLKQPYPFSARAYAARGVSNLCLGNNVEALRDLNMAIAEKPINSSYINSRAQCYAKTGQYLKALKDCDLAIELNPKLADAYLERAMVYRSLGKLKLAYDSASKAISLNPGLSYAHTVIGVYYVGEKKPELALRSFDKALSIDRNNVWAKDQRTRLLQAGANRQRDESSHETRHADRLQKKAEADSPDKVALSTATPLSLLKLGYVQLQSGQVQQAILTLSQGVRKNPNDPILRRYFAHALMQGGEARLVLGQIKALYQLNALTPEDTLLLGKAQNQLGQFGASIASYRECLPKKGLKIEAIKGIVDAYVKSNDITKAKAMLLDMIAKSGTEEEKQALLSIMQRIPSGGRAFPDVKPDNFPTKALEG
jgi:tetratricopeptide (TPR) repeat protein